jgi:SAM-dependent methyltransferase
MARHTDTFIPQGASRFWPFVVGTTGAYCQPPPAARFLLCWRLMQAVLGIQPTEPRENWRHLPRELLATLMQKEGAGNEHPSRAFVASLIDDGESVLDVGCGAGVGYESLAAMGLGSHYLGVDSSEPSIEIARELYPLGDFRVGQATALVSQFGSNSFDVVIARHVLEHQPDFELAMEQAIGVSRRLAVFVFFLTPRKLPFGVRKLDPGFNGQFLYTNIYSKRSTDNFLTRSRLHWCWDYNVGTSRAGWFANEVNCILRVSRTPLRIEESL